MLVKLGRWSAVAGLAIVGCGGGAVDDGADEVVAEADARAALTGACSTQQGIGYLKRTYGDNYCECWADRAKTTLSADNYTKLVKATQLELKAADRADRDQIVMANTAIYSAVSAGAGSCKAGG